MSNRLSEQPGEPQARRDFITGPRRLQVLEGVSGAQAVGAIERITKEGGTWLQSRAMVRNSGGTTARAQMRISITGIGNVAIGNWVDISPGQERLVVALWSVKGSMAGAWYTVFSKVNDQSGNIGIKQTYVYVPVPEI